MIKKEENIERKLIVLKSKRIRDIPASVRGGQVLAAEYERSRERRDCIIEEEYENIFSSTMFTSVSGLSSFNACKCENLG
jgi:hypothetical protein